MTFTQLEAWFEDRLGIRPSYVRYVSDHGTVFCFVKRPCSFPTETEEVLAREMPAYLSVRVLYDEETDAPVSKPCGCGYENFYATPNFVCSQCRLWKEMQ